MSNWSGKKGRWMNWVIRIINIQCRLLGLNRFETVRNQLEKFDRCVSLSIFLIFLWLGLFFTKGLVKYPRSSNLASSSKLRGLKGELDEEPSPSILSLSDAWMHGNSSHRLWFLNLHNNRPFSSSHLSRTSSLFNDSHTYWPLSSYSLI